MEYDVNVEYDENCEYKSSYIKKRLPIITESQEINISVVSDKPSIHIGESCLLTVTCKSNELPVKIGYITIDNLKTKCILDENGQARIRYVPTNMGENNIVVRYNDKTGLFSTAEYIFTINTEKIPTTTILTNVNTIANLEESVTLKARVQSNDEPLIYGRVTFLHYLFYPKDNITADRIEKIIGNPVYLDENGEASITYIPMQSYHDDDDIEYTTAEEPSIEYVRAVYNYNKDGEHKDEEGKEVVQWEYYEMSSDMGRIHIKQPNTIRLDAYQTNGNGSLIEEIDIKDYKGYVEAQNSIVFRAYIELDDNHAVTFHENDKIQISMHGTVYTGNRTGFAEINETYIATYEDLNFFTTEPINLAPGYYDFYAISNVEYGEYDEKPKYLQSIQESMHYYLQVDYNQNTNVTMSASQYAYNINQGESIDIVITVNNLTSNQLNVLLHQKCYLFAPSSIYESDFIQQNDTLQAQFTVTLDSIDDYSLYAYTNSIAENNEYIPALYTDNINVFVTGQKTLSIQHTEYINQYYPGAIKYKVSVQGIKNEIVAGEVYNYTDINNKGEPIETLNFDSIDNQYDCNIPNIMHSEAEYLMPGEYTLELMVNNDSVTTSYQIFKAILTHENSRQLANTILGVPQQQANIVISSNGGDLSEFDNNNIHIFVKKSSQEDNPNNYKECTNIVSVKTEDNKHATVGFDIGVYTEDTWDIKFEYTDDYFISLANNLTSFTTTLVSPSFIVQEDDNNDISISINNPQAEYIPLLVELTNDADYLKFICVTDADGKVTLVAPEDKTIWNLLNKVKITTNPTNAELIDAILEGDGTPSSIRYDDNFEDTIFFGPKAEAWSDIDEDQVIIENVTYIEDEEPNDGNEGDTSDEEGNGNGEGNDNNEGDILIDPEDPSNPEEPEEPIEILSDEEIIFNGLRNQLINYESTYLFTMYKEATMSYARN